MEDSLQSLIAKVDNICLVLPETHHGSWGDIQDDKQRKHVYAGEVLDFGLKVTFPETNGEPTGANDMPETWKSLCYAASAGYSSPLNSGADVDAASLRMMYALRSMSVEAAGSANPSKGGERRFSDGHSVQSDKLACSPFASVAMQDADSSSKSRTVSKKQTEPVCFLNGRNLVLPMSVSLGDLPDVGGAFNHIATISVDITKPRLILDKDESDRLDMLLRCPLEEVIQSEEKHHIIHNVSADFPVLPPPQVTCQHFSVSGKHYLVTKVCNTYPEELLICNIQVFVNKNSNLEATCPSSVLSSDGGDWSSFLAIELIPSQRDQLSTSLHPEEEHTFVFQVTWDCSLPSNRPDEPVQFPLFLVIKWHTPSMAVEQSIQTHYHLPTVTMDFPAFIVLAQCQSPVGTGQSFTVTYTLLNNLQDFLGVTLIWLPDKDRKGDRLEDSNVAGRLVCQEPVKQLGPSKKGSTIKVPITFQALQAGIQELGKYMKMKLQYAAQPLASKISSVVSQPSKSSPHSSSPVSSVTTATSSSSAPKSLPENAAPESSDTPTAEQPSPTTTTATSNSPVALRKVFSIGPNSVLIKKKSALTRQMSLSPASAHPIKKFLAGIRSHSFSGESVGDAGHHDDQSGDLQRDGSAESDPEIRSSPTASTPPASEDQSAPSIDRIVKHRCQVYVA
ncbi:trafficking protein particle complex subunit 14-like [Diadema setosum]|uniref:trafficking protein particle complex subunit 14-like n=1 Tax=Diadema setosum TaxID=31175 RepID=UPI003B3AC848